MATATVPLPRVETTLPLASAPAETTKAEPSPRTLRW
jgi:hypothetical protein